MVPLILPMLALGCQLSAATAILDDGDTGDTGAADAGSGDAGGDDGAGTDGGASDGGSSDGGSSDGGSSDGGSGDPLESDDDDDGWTEVEGDCDDTDPEVNPGRVDDCDGVDSDCDGEVDDAASEDDETEPNDTTAYSLGDLAVDPELQALASLHNDDDIDLFRFELDDSSWSIFSLDVSVSNIPSGASYRVVVENLDRGEVYLDEVGSGTLSVSVGDTLLQDDGGTWQIRVTSEGGADCGRDYLVAVGLD